MVSEEQGIPDEVEFQCHCQPLSGCTTLFVRTAELTGKGLIRLRLRDGEWDSGTVYLDTDQRKQLAELVAPSEAADADRAPVDAGERDGV
jgi:hypothetical protein